MHGDAFDTGIGRPNILNQREGVQNIFSGAIKIGGTIAPSNPNFAKSLENQKSINKYTEVIQNLKKKEKQQKELIVSLTKKLKNEELKNQEETKISIELKKRHDILQKKVEILVKEKSHSFKQLK